MTADLDHAVIALRGNGLVVYPTETVYGIGASARSRVALERLLALKGRDAAKGVSVLVSDLADAEALVGGEPPAAARVLVQSFWPGPLTLVLPAAPGLDPLLMGPNGGVALRCSADPLARALLAKFGGPLTSTSANPSGLAPATTVTQAREYFGERVDAYVDGGTRASSAISTVVEFSQTRAYLRRAGAIGLDALRAVTVVESEIA